MKFKKYFKIKHKNNKKKQYNNLISGSAGLKSLSSYNLKTEELSSTIKSLKRIIKKKNFLIINSTPFWSLTQKPRDIRMGRGKGAPSTKVFPTRAGKILLEIKGVDERISERALRISATRLSCPTKIVLKNNDQRTNCFKSFW